MRAATAARSRFVLALAATAASLTCATTGPAVPMHLLPVAEQTLPSGLRVVIEQDLGSAVAGVVLTVDVGSVDDPPGKHGMAHTLEHLAFRAPDPGGRSMYARLVRLGAASFNGETEIERTTYWAVGPRQTLDEMLAIVLGRLADPLAGMDDKLFAKESRVVAEEVHKREGASGWEVMMPALLPPGHPHARAWAERDATPPLSLAEIRRFSEVFYRPERMTLVISGPVPLELEKALTGKLPAAWQGRAAERRAPIRRPATAFEGPRPAPPDLPTHKSIAVVIPELWMAWRVPPASGIAASRLEVLARVVERMLSGRLDWNGTNDVLNIDVWPSPGRMASAIVCRFKLRSPNDAVRIRNETRGALEALADVTLIHMKARLRASYNEAVIDGVLRTALRLDSLSERTKAEAALVHFESGAQSAQVIDALAKITVDEVADFAGRYLTPDAARAVLLLPEEVRNVTHVRSRWKKDARETDASAGTEPDREAESEPEAEADAETTAAAPVPAPALAPPSPPDLQATVVIPGARAALIRRLSNGLSVIAMRRAGLPFVSMLLGFHADPQPGDAPGARVAFGEALRWDLSAAPLDRGILRSRKLHGDNAQVALSTFAANLETALDLLSEEGETLHVSWPNPAFIRWVDREAIQASAPDAQAARAFRSALFGDHPYRLDPTAEVARQLTAREAEAWFARVRRPANGVLVIVGDITPETAVQAAEKALHGWKGDGAPPPPPPAPASPGPPTTDADGGARLLYTSDPRRQSAYVRFGCVLPPVRAPRDNIVHQHLAGMMQANLRRRLRLVKGVTYGYDVDADVFRGGTAVLLGHLDVDGKSAPDAIEVLRDWFDDTHTSPITAKRFEQHRWNRARRSGLMNATGSQLARSLLNAWNMGWEPAVLDDYARDLASVTQKDIVAALDACRKNAVISVLGPGPN